MKELDPFSPDILAEPLDKDSIKRLEADFYVAAAMSFGTLFEGIAAEQFSRCLESSETEVGETPSVEFTAQTDYRPNEPKPYQVSRYILEVSTNYPYFAQPDYQLVETVRYDLDVFRLKIDKTLEYYLRYIPNDATITLRYLALKDAAVPIDQQLPKSPQLPVAALNKAARQVIFADLDDIYAYLHVLSLPPDVGQHGPMTII